MCRHCLRILSFFLNRGKGKANGLLHLGWIEIVEEKIPNAISHGFFESFLRVDFMLRAVPFLGRHDSIVPVSGHTSFN